MKLAMEFVKAEGNVGDLIKYICTCINDQPDELSRFSHVRAIVHIRKLPHFLRYRSEIPKM